MESVTKALALSELRPGEKFNWQGEDYANLVWEDTTSKPSESDINAKYDAIIADSAWRQLRWRRDGMLYDCDWTQNADAPGDTAAWATYRQALRDLPANTSDPADVNWPTPPA